MLGDVFLGFAGVAAVVQPDGEDVRRGRRRKKSPGSDLLVGDAVVAERVALDSAQCPAVLGDVGYLGRLVQYAAELHGTSPV